MHSLARSVHRRARNPSKTSRIRSLSCTPTRVMGPQKGGGGLPLCQQLRSVWYATPCAELGRPRDRPGGYATLPMGLVWCRTRARQSVGRHPPSPCGLAAGWVSGVRPVHWHRPLTWQVVPLWPPSHHPSQYACAHQTPCSSSSECERLTQR